MSFIKFIFFLSLMDMFLLADDMYFAIKLEVQTDKDTLIENAQYLEDNLSKKINILQFSPSLFAAYSQIDENRTKLELEFEKYRKIFLSAYIEKVDFIEYNNQKIMSGITQNKQNLETEVYFSFGDANLSLNAQNNLDKFLQNIPFKNNSIYIKGHTDSVSIGKSPYADNLDLSYHRALNVKKYVVHNLKWKEN